MKTFAEKAFTLVELLIVIGIIGVLAVTLIVGLNPAEAQKKARDTKRLADMQKLQSIISQALQDNVLTTAQTGAVLDSSTLGGAVTQQSCAAGNFLGVNLCTYTNTIPVDPSNNKTGRCVDSQTANNTVPGCEFGYYVFIDAGLVDYEINMKMESLSNRARVGTDGGGSRYHYEVFTSNANLIGNAMNY